MSLPSSAPTPLVSGVARAKWLARRGCVLLFGQGPRRFVSDDARRARTSTVFWERGGPFAAPAPLWTESTLPSRVADWPRDTLQEPERTVIMAENAALYDDDGAIYDRSTHGAYPETLESPEGRPERHLALTLPRLKMPRRLPGLSFFLGGLGGQTFFHFLIEILPKLHLLAQANLKVERLIVQGHFERNKAAWLAAVGASLPVEWIGPLDHLHCERLAFTPRVVDHYRPNPWAIATLRRLVEAPSPRRQRFRRVWIDRSGSSVRPVAWERDIVATLPAGWDAIDFAQLTPAETLRTCSECTHLAGFHGAGFANAAFCPPGTQVLEFYTAPNHTWYPTLSAVCGHNHFVHLGVSDAAGVTRHLECANAS